MMRLVIIGASALGREVCTYAREIGMKVKGFLDSRANMLENFAEYPPILSDVEGYNIDLEDVFVCAVGDPAPRRNYCEIIARKGGKFVPIIHPTAVIGDNVKIGSGCVLRPYSVVGNDTLIGNHVIIGTQSLVAHDCNIGDYVTISPGCHVAGWCRLSYGVFLGIHSAIIPHINVGFGVVVGAGGVVVKDVETGTVIGVPARQKL